eukprot:COSAG06_NODE_36_length_30622_cov_18.404869_15_plen_576_part_00
MVRRPCRGPATVALLVLAALGRAQQVWSCSSNGDCGHGTCHGYSPGSPGDPTATPPVPARPATPGTCSCSAGYTGAKCASPVSCGPAPSPPQSAGCSGEKHYQEQCTATCGTGWTGGSTSATFTCGADGHYSGSLTCERVSCGPAPSPPQSTGCNGEKHYQEQCTATCGTGWTGGSTTSTTFTCGANGHYTGSSLTCERVSCGPAPSPPQSTGCSGQKLFQEHCTATCEDGWTGGAADAHATFTCEADRSYSGSLNCQKVSCGLAPTPPHSTGCSGQKLFQEHCTATCASGWTGGTKERTFTCEADGRKKSGQYDQDAFSCETISCPTLPPTPENAVSDCDKGGLHHFQDTCQATCKSGWTGGDKAASFECVPNQRESTGHFSGSLTCEKVSCGTAPSPPNSHSADCAGEKKFGDSCTATCDEGWTGGQADHPAKAITTTLICEADPPGSGLKTAGKFTGTHGTSLTCEKVSCHTLPRPAHSDKYPVTPSSASCTGEKHFNDKCTVECDRCWNAGQQAKGHKSKEFTCTSKSAEAPDGKFDPPATALVCERACYPHPTTTTRVSFLSPAVCTCVD